MHWQDYVFSIGNVVFFAALIPSIISKHKPALSTSLMTGGFLIIFAATYVTLHLYLTSIMVTVSAVAWLVLAVQKYLQTRKAD